MGGGAVILASVRSSIRGAGGNVDPEAAEWMFHRARRCAAVDPEGNVIQLVEASE